MKDDYTNNSHYLTYISLALKGWENVPFDLGSKEVKVQEVLSLPGLLHEGFKFDCVDE